MFPFGKSKPETPLTALEALKKAHYSLASLPEMIRIPATPERGETDAKKQIALWQEAQKLIITNVCVIPITETGQVWARREKLKWGFDLKGSMSLGPLVTEQTHFVD